MAKTRAFGSSENSMSSSTLSSFWKEQASATLRGNRSSTKPRISSALIASTSDGSSKQNLLERVAAQSETERLERDHLVGRDVADVDVRPEVLDEPRLARLRGCLEDQVARRHLVGDLLDETGAHVAVLAEDAGGATFTRLGDHLPGAGLELFLDPRDPLVRRVDDVGVLRADLREDGEVAGELCDQLELAVARNVERAVGDLDVREAMLRKPALELVHAPTRIDDFEERPAADDRRLEVPVERDLLLEVVRDVARAPAELHDVHELTGGVEHPLDVAGVEAFVDDVRQAFLTRLARALGEPQEAVAKAGHRAPPTWLWHGSGRRGRESSRGRR